MQPQPTPAPIPAPAAEAAAKSDVRDLKSDVDARFTEMRGDMNARLSEMNARLIAMQSDIQGILRAQIFFRNGAIITLISAPLGFIVSRLL